MLKVRWTLNGKLQALSPFHVETPGERAEREFDAWDSKAMAMLTRLAKEQHAVQRSIERHKPLPDALDEEESGDEDLDFKVLTWKIINEQIIELQLDIHLNHNDFLCGKKSSRRLEEIWDWEARTLRVAAYM